MSNAEVDTFCPDPWPGELISELKFWEQGCLLNSSSILWLGVGEKDVVTGQTSESDWTAMNVFNPSGWSIIVSQTCDIAAEGPGSKHPFVLCCPLKKCTPDFNPATLGNIKKWRSKYLVPVTGCPEPGDWIADLRILVPVSKSLLLGKPIIPGYVDKKDQKKLSDQVASKFRRAALPNIIQGELRYILNESMKQVKNLDSDLGGIEQIRLECLPDENNLQQLRIHVIAPTPIDASVREPFESRKNEVKGLIEGKGIKFLGLAFDELPKILVTDYRAWVPIDIKLLPQAWF